MKDFIPLRNMEVIPVFDKTPHSFANVLELLLPCDCYEKDTFKNTNYLNYLKERDAKIYFSVRELLDIQMEAQQNGEYELSDRVINNAVKILDLIIKENIELPHLASNSMKQIGFTWDTPNHRIYITVDDAGKIIFTSVELNSPYNYLSFQGYTDNINKVMTMVKDEL
ncbi:MAG: hypothetical protein LBD98_03905 [Endomicrobium sp.]|jgi:hypothetical protein|nr:hypothetical protein [Endomicrobium sp.]